jgi:hypothetical protein
LSLLALLGAWLLLFLLGFGLVLLAVEDGAFADALRSSGSSLFTIGFADVEGGASGVHFGAAATGLVVVALQIAYLPTLYSAFNRREMLVTLLETRAGAPAWGPEVLARHHLVGIVDNLPTFYAEWEQWAADVAETHTTYPTLIWFRSPQRLQSWVGGLLAVMDSAALYLSLSPSAAPSEARLCVRMGYTCIRRIADVLRIEYTADPRPDEAIALTYEEFAQGVAHLALVGFPMERTAEEAWPHFRGWRVNYETAVYALADRTVAAPALWSGLRRHLPQTQLPPARPPHRTPDD